MNVLRTLYHLALADFYERVRRYRFLLVLAAVIYLGVQVNNGTWFLYLLPRELSLTMSGYRGEFNSAWIGTMTVLVTNLVLGLFGFYLVSGTIRRMDGVEVRAVSKAKPCPEAQPVTPNLEDVYLTMVAQRQGGVA